jgi:hypothetical protein
MIEVTTVPYRAASAPNFSVTGFQRAYVTNDHPN